MNIRYLTPCLVVICLLGCSFATPKPKTAQRSLTHFQDANFGVRFSHTDQVSTSYNPHGGADRVMIAYQEKPIGGLLIRSAPPAGSIDDFIATGKEHFKKKYGASSVDYTLYKNSHKYKFHYFKADVTLQDTNYIIENFIYLRENVKMESEASAILAAISGAFIFEFLCQKEDYERITPEIKTVINSFTIEDSP